MRLSLSKVSTDRSEEFASRDPLLVRLAVRPEIASVILLAVMSMFLVASTSTFATEENLVWVTYNFSVIAIATIGMLLVFAAGDIDFSIGAEIGTNY